MVERKLKVRLGAFIALAMAGLTALVILFGGTPRVFTNRTEYVVTYPEAPGIVNGTPVRKSGIRIGQVKALDIDESTGKVRVSIEVEDKYLPKDRAEDCPREYSQVAFAFQELIGPHVDEALAKKVFAREWLPAPANAGAPARFR